MTWILPEGAWLQFEGLTSPVQILRGLGSGTQGQVFEVAVAGERLALKWYLPRCLEQDPNLERRLLESIRATAPSRAFLWPIALLRPNAESRPLIRSKQVGFGYLMELRPQQFVGAVDHYAGRLAISLGQALARVVKGEEGDEALERYNRQRQQANVAYVQELSVRNKKNLEEKDPAQRAQRMQELRAVCADPVKAREYLLNSSMINSIHRAQSVA